MEQEQEGAENSIENYTKLKAKMTDMQKKINDLDRDNGILKALLFRDEIKGIREKQQNKEKWMVKYLKLQKKYAVATGRLNEKVEKLKVELVHAQELYEISQLKNQQREQDERSFLGHLEDSFNQILEKLLSLRSKEEPDLCEETEKAQLTAQRSLLIKQECIKDMFCCSNKPSPDKSAVNAKIISKLEDPRYFTSYRKVISSFLEPTGGKLEKSTIAGIKSKIRELINEVCERRNSMAHTSHFMSTENGFEVKKLWNENYSSYSRSPITLSHLSNFAKICAEPNSLSVTDKELLAYAVMHQSEKRSYKNSITPNAELVGVDTIDFIVGDINEGPVEEADHCSFTHGADLHAIMPDFEVHSDTENAKASSNPGTKRLDMSMSFMEHHKDADISAINKVSTICGNLHQSEDDNDYASILNNLNDNEPEQMTVEEENIVEEDPKAPWFEYNFEAITRKKPSIGSRPSVAETPKLEPKLGDSTICMPSDLSF